MRLIVVVPADIGYRFADHAAYLEAFADQPGLRDVTVVGHDWGAVLGLDLLRRRPDIVAAIAVCEGHLGPFGCWADRGPGASGLFSRLRAPGIGERLVLHENFFIEQILPGGMNRTLSAAEHDAYRDPFRTPRDLLPVLRWIQQIPVGGDPADVDWCRRQGAGLEIVSVGAGTHFLPEDQQDVIGRALTAWLANSR